MRMMSVVGARPQFVKLGAVCRAVARRARAGQPIEDFIVHTGQHYDAGMSDIFFDELEIPAPNVNLEIGSGTHGAQTARMLEGIEKLLLEQRPDAVVVYGDTNSTVAGALAAAKLGVPIVHVEAGLRSWNRAMPEEINRVATDHLADLLLAPTPAAIRNLEAEGLASRTVFTGDVMLDAVRHALALARQRSRIVEQLGLEAGGYAVVTIHRADNTNAAPLRRLLDVLNELAANHWPVVFPVHPRTTAVMKSQLADWQPHERLHLIEPLGHLDVLRLVDGSRLVLTDSGGLQKEAFFVGRPCVTLRSETEWIETVEAGGNVVAGTERDGILAAVEHWSKTPFNGDLPSSSGGAPFGNGDAGERTIDAILNFRQLQTQTRTPS